MTYNFMVLLRLFPSHRHETETKQIEIDRGIENTLTYSSQSAVGSASSSLTFLFCFDHKTRLLYGGALPSSPPPPGTSDLSLCRYNDTLTDNVTGSAGPSANPYTQTHTEAHHPSTPIRPVQKEPPSLPSLPMAILPAAGWGGHQQPADDQTNRQATVAGLILKYIVIFPTRTERLGNFTIDGWMNIFQFLYIGLSLSTYLSRNALANGSPPHYN
ncbi:hypothetical protein Kpol_1059p20 [Vanderwaltozyma polyspora DSM 70294]|uniref:Uncharacterized protein n=1 Tax=Vanderwaltozyma polyspora (strain ATCC 22028 / DSM 70294 / BCRC 21397 / CBS 2163 / NBRC 10782 / NRRL Y-8283 / UCD 57-17) TaxID=436907 RepID=A7TN24_VANPO|nr:uncharacterized protein Kpol_1059p20 [Vanderwaltozyma polyspora DSM 70294]EDO16330.1 hypothetical protein Kpol_1059p20 [Vanderwaltozyma polyspora DSM 70294]